MNCEKKKIFETSKIDSCSCWAIPFWWFVESRHSDWFWLFGLTFWKVMRTYECYFLILSGVTPLQVVDTSTRTITIKLNSVRLNFFCTHRVVGTLKRSCTHWLMSRLWNFHCRIFKTFTVDALIIQSSYLVVAFKQYNIVRTSCTLQFICTYPKIQENFYLDFKVRIQVLATVVKRTSFVRVVTININWTMFSCGNILHIKIKNPLNI